MNGWMNMTHTTIYSSKQNNKKNVSESYMFNKFKLSYKKGSFKILHRKIMFITLCHITFSRFPEFSQLLCENYYFNILKSCFDVSVYI